MITEMDLREAIAECEGTRNPNANTCIKLAAYYTIFDHTVKKDPLPEAPVVPSYSYATPKYTSQSEFGGLLSEKDEYGVMTVMDELMDTIHVLNPRLYDSVIRKLKAL